MGSRQILANANSRNGKILEWYRECKSKDTQALTTIFAKLQKYYNVYRQSFDTRRFAAFKNFVQINFVFAVIEAAVAQKVQSTFGAWPIVEFVATSAEDVAVARRNSTLVSAQLIACDSFLKAVDFYLSAEIYGTAIARLGWKQRGQMARIRMPDGLGGERPLEGYVTTFDGPDWDIVNLFDFWPEAGKRRLRDCKRAMHRYWLDLDDIRVAEAAGDFDKGSALALESSEASMAINDEFTSQQNFYRNMIDYQARQGNKFQKRIQCVDLVGEVPSMFAPDGFVNRIITVANDRVLLKNRPFPFHHERLDKIFFAYSPTIDPEYFHGIGKAEVMEKMQYLVNRYASQKADAVDQAVEPMWIVNELGGVDLSNITTKSGKVIKVAGPVDDSNIRPFVPDLSGIPIATNEIDQHWQFMQIASGGIQDVGLGGEGPSRETATSVATRSQRALSRGTLQALIGEASFVEKLAEGIRDLNRQFLSLPHQVQMIGSEAMINPITGFPLPTEPTIIDHFDVAVDLRARAMGASQQIGKQGRKQDWMTLLQIIGGMPPAQQVLNWQSVLNYTFRTFDVPNTQDFFLTKPAEINQTPETPGPNDAVNAAASGMGGEAMPPEVMAMMNEGGMG